jgi:site-specific recombinase XerD
VQLILATNDFRIGGQAYPGFPLILWDDMESCTAVNTFLRYYLLRGAIGSRKSWPSTGRALYDYFSFLQAHDLGWCDVSRGEEKSLLVAYRDYSFSFAKLARNTIRQRLLYICEFYEFAQTRGWVENLPFGTEDRSSFHREPRFMSHGGSLGIGNRTRDVMPRKHKDLPKFLSKEQVKLLIQAASNPHHRMLICLALQTGLRKQEIATFPLAYVFNPAGRKEQNIHVCLDPSDGNEMLTKGSKPRDIWISHKLMEDLHQYVVHWRGERASLANANHKNLFLNQSGQPFSCDGKSIDRIVRTTGKRADVKVHTHMLRHTYATHTLVALQKNRGEKKIEPLVFLQRQLGHASIQTTMVYLHLINELADEAVLQYDDELNGLAEV